MVTFRKKYFLLTLILFIVEVLIATFFHGGFIRNYIGDFLVVIFVYCLIRTFFKIPVITVAAGVLIFSYLVEFSQYLDLAKHLGFEKSTLAGIVLGHSFEWFDMVVYTLGIIVVVAIERIMQGTLND